MDRIWLKSYQESVPTDVDDRINRYHSILDLLDENFQKFGDMPAWYCMGKYC